MFPPFRARTAAVAACAAVALVGLAGPAAPARAQSQPAAAPAVTIVAPAGAVTLTVKGADAISRLVVRNDTGRTATPTARILTDAGDLWADPAELVVAAQPLAPGAAGALNITVTGKTKVSGRLIVGLAHVEGAREAVAAIATPVAKPKAATKVAVQPDEVQIDLVHDCPFLCGDHTTSRVWVAGVTNQQLKDHDIRGIGSGEGGQTALAVLRPQQKSEADDLAGHPPGGHYVNAEAYAKATGHGDYKVTLTLDPGADKPTQLVVKVRQRDWVLWALLVLLAGAALGGVTHGFYDARRARAVLRFRLEQLLKDYSDALKDAPPRMPALRPLFGAIDDGPPPVPKGKACDTAERGSFADLYCRVQASRSDKDVEALDAEVTAAEGTLLRWLGVNRAMRRLQTASDAVPAAVRHGSDPFMAAMAKQLDQVDVPADLPATATLVAAIESHAALVPLYEATRELSARHHDLTRCRPSTIYLARVKKGSAIGTHTPGEMAALEAALETAHGELAEREEHEVHLPPRATFLLRSGSQLLAEHRLSAAGAARAAAAPAVPPPPDPRLLMRAIARMDWVVFVVTVPIASAVYVVTLYSGKPWGSLADYITAFGGGFAGTALVGVAVIPLIRGTLGRVVR
jgi:hypothetical protein